MKNFKRTISAILIAISLTSTVTSFLVVETVYAATAKKKAAPKKTKAQIDADKAAANQEKYCQNAYKQSCADYQKAIDKSDANNKAEQACTKDGKYSSCAEKQQKEDAAAQTAAEGDLDNLTYGTFDVQKQLKLDGDNQEKAYFKEGSPIVNFIMSIINFAITIMGAIAVILFIIAGFMFMAANGESQKLENAKDIIKYAAIGLIVALLSYVITIFVQSIFANG